MISTEHWLVHEHTQFEVLVKECRTAIEITDWWATEQFLKKMFEELRYHMAQEEEILFPAYDKKCESSASHGSTLELYNEHSVIIDGFRKLKKAVDSRSAEDAFELVVDLELLLLEHNKKEEQTFLPFASHLLFDDREELALKLNNFMVTNKSRNWGVEPLH